MICVIRGCVPKKLLAYGSAFRDAFEDARGFGWDAHVPEFDWPTLIGAKDREIARLEARRVGIGDIFRQQLLALLMPVHLAAQG